MPILRLKKRFTASQLRGYGYAFATMGECHMVLLHGGQEVAQAYYKSREIQEQMIARWTTTESTKSPVTNISKLPAKFHCNPPRK